MSECSGEMPIEVLQSVGLTAVERWWSTGFGRARLLYSVADDRRRLVVVRNGDILTGAWLC